MTVWGTGGCLTDQIAANLVYSNFWTGREEADFEKGGTKSFQTTKV